MISAIRKGKYSINLSNGEHSITSDVEKKFGGEDLGLNSHELVEAALASCTSQTLLLYANRKGWELPELTVETQILKEASESQIEVKIHLGNVNEEQRARLMEIAGKCPIHKLLTSNVKIEMYEK